MAEKEYQIGDLEQAPFQMNLADYLDEEELDVIGRNLLVDIEEDKDSRQEWMETNIEWLKLASQVMETKTYPWPGASNVKYPLLTIASMQFHARALPGLIPDDRPVKAKIFGRRDPEGKKVERAERVSEYMSYQLLDEQDEWLDEMDRMLFILPMVGICYKKSFYSSRYARNKSELILPNSLHINYYAKDFKGADKTHEFHLSVNDLVGLQRQGVYLNVELGEPMLPDKRDINGRQEVSEMRPDEHAHDTPYTLYESECWLDIDEDGYKEPYFVTLEATSGKVLRIAARWTTGDVKYNDKGEVAEINDFSQITPYIFLPDPSSAVSGMGLGTLLGPTNEAVNTLINQLIDAGTMNTLAGGFLAKGVGLRGGATKFKPNEWKIVNSTGDDLRKSVLPLPVREPSNVLFQLLGMLTNAGERIGSVTDMMVGENPGQNQKATTSMAVLEQGMQVFSSIYKRIYRALRKELKKFYVLNYEFLDEAKYNTFFDDEERLDVKYDFNSTDMDIMPAADPTIVTDTQRLTRANALLELAGMGTVNPQVATRRVLEAQRQEDISELMTMPEPQPSIDQLKLEWEKEKETMSNQIKIMELKLRGFETMAKTRLTDAQADKATAEANLILPQAQIEALQKQNEVIDGRLEIMLKMNGQGEGDGSTGQKGEKKV